MKWLSASVLLVFSAFACAQTSPIHSGSTVYIEPMHGYESYLMAAFAQKHVPLVIVTEKDKADYLIRTNINHFQPNQPAVVINNSNTGISNGGNDAFNQGWQSGQQAAARRAALGVSSSNISVVDPHSSQIVFSYAASKSGGNQIQKTAEDCAKHLKEFIEKAEKPKK